MTVTLDNNQNQAPIGDGEPRAPINRAVLLSFVGYSALFLLALIVASLMVYNYLHGEYGRHAVVKLEEDLIAQKALNDKQHEELERLRADVQDLRSGLVAIEEHARTDLGLIKQGEIFVQLATVTTKPIDMPKVSHEPDAKEALEADTLEGGESP